MFENYHGKLKTPDNSTKPLQSVQYEVYDYWTNLSTDLSNIDFTFRRKDTVEIPYTMNKIVYVEPDSVNVLDIGLEEPTGDTYGFQGQRMYNPVSMRSWTMVMCVPTLKAKHSAYLWEEDQMFTIPTNGVLPLIITPNMADKEVVFELQNYRHEPLLDINTYQQRFVGLNEMKYTIDKEISDQLNQGNYFIDVYCLCEDQRLHLDTISLYID